VNLKFDLLSRLGEVVLLTRPTEEFEELARFHGRIEPLGLRVARRTLQSEWYQQKRKALVHATN